MSNKRDKQYWLNRLGNERPDLMEEVNHGRMTIYGAVVAAGWRKKIQSVPADLTELAGHFQKRLSKQEMNLLIKKLQEVMPSNQPEK